MIDLSVPQALAIFSHWNHINLKKYILEMTWRSPRIGVPQIIHSQRMFPSKPSILGYHHFEKHPYSLFTWVMCNMNFTKPCSLLQGEAPYLDVASYTLSVLWPIKPYINQVRSQLNHVKSINPI